MDVVRPPTSESKTIETTPRKPKVKKQSKHGNKMEGRKNAKEEEMDLKPVGGSGGMRNVGDFLSSSFSSAQRTLCLAPPKIPGTGSVVITWYQVPSLY